MPNSKTNQKTSQANSTSSEAEILALRKEIEQLRLENAAAYEKLNTQQAIHKNFEVSHSRFEAIFYQSVLGQKIISADLKITQVNEALQRMMGYSKAELIGTRITEFAHPDFVLDWQALQKKLWEEQIPSFQIETCLLNKDGTSFWCRVTSILFQDQDATLGFTIVENIDKRKLLELELKKLYDNQETIMHMVAHDLKSPINNIMMAARFLKENLEESGEKRQEKAEQILSYVNLISETSDRALHLISELLLIGEIESRYLTLEETDLKDYIQLHLNSLRIVAERKCISLMFHHTGKPVFAAIDRDKFRWVLENLLSNAVKFSQENGQISLTLKEVGGKKMLQVQDNGIGIPAELLATVFQKFTKARRQGTNGEPTTGLGLYIVKQIIDEHKGRVWIESQVDAGTSVFIELP
ncbi:PAS domain-containing sensor histidine kinase [Pontibacter lucknowensis]|uniref:histidine kinase n=1 Tax=Pontibacter lucknowensis TaxID=1077936 RepID=A0A1N7AMZ2_9BACT|nr:PAS domain-containing sensor histidine kinase [Pontibacter lucknowensis]SIR40386.1 two-component system, OmpR family, sensor histidine kinase VicK [Pontibacter lucknowensis]